MAVAALVASIETASFDAISDTSVWTDYLRFGTDSALQPLLAQRRVRMHPFVVGAIALGSLRDRKRVIGDMTDLHHVTVATDDEVMELIAQSNLCGTGIGWVDAHLIASVLLTPGTRLLSLDRRLEAVCLRLSMAASVAH